MTKYVKLLVDSFSEMTREADPDDEWDRGDSYTQWNVTGLKLDTKDSRRALPVDEDVEVGQTLYAVYAIYSTGDTFGHDEGACIELVSLHKTEEITLRNVIAIETGYKESGSLMIELDNGEKISRYCPWDGYFESLDSVQIGEFTVE
jgi:hypothetical protein